MPPKKTVNKTEGVRKLLRDKVPKTRFKREKPELKIPTVLKLRIPIAGQATKKKHAVQPEVSSPEAAVKQMSVLDKSNEGQGSKKNHAVPKASSPKVAAKKSLVSDKTNEGHAAKKNNAVQPVSPPKAATKRMLMMDRINEVAKAQLVKDCPVSIESSSENNTVKKKRGRKKKIQPESEADLGTKEMTEKKVKSPPAKVSSKEISSKKKLKEKSVTPKKTRQSKPILTRHKPITKADGTVKRKYTRRKNVIKTDTESTITSPSILSQNLMDHKPSNMETQKPQKPPVIDINNTDSRRTSVASEWSWTKDISGSSTTTCITVASTDFVRIDGKLPVIKLNNIDFDLRREAIAKKEGEHSLSEDSSSSSSSSCSSTSSSSSGVSTTVDNALNLSSSSGSPTKPRSPTYTPVEASPAHVNMLSTLESLSSKLQSFDLESWSEDENEDFLNMKDFEVSIFKVMEEEHCALLECNFLSRILSDKCFVSESHDLSTTESEANFVKPDASVISNKAAEARGECHSSGRRRDSLSLEPGDDEDALSLFAESIACESRAPEYVPQPVRRDAPRARLYLPTKIPDPKAKPVCEKQSADSTSLQREDRPPGLCENKPSGAVDDKSRERVDPAAWTGHKRLTITSFDLPYGVRATVLRGVCFFNLISNCKKVNCMFLHRELPVAVVARRLTMMSERQFLQEFTHCAKWPDIRRQYSKCFVLECQRRELPTFLVEMVIVYISKTNFASKEDMAIQVDLIEHALLYLNNVDLAVCEDLLKYKFSSGKFLCEVFMETIANTQNFWRFKPVFMNLTGFMVRANRTFKYEVATQILERVCIFPFEAPLALVVLSILKSTDRKIFENSMMKIYEKQLINFSKDMHERFLALKDQRESGPTVELASSPAVGQEVAPLNGTLVPSDSEKRYTSPDTTNLDNQQIKPSVEPIITRTINLEKIRALNTAKPNGEDNRSSFEKHSASWLNRSIYDKIPRFCSPQGAYRTSQPRPQMPLKRPMGRQVLYGPRQFKYPRRTGPDHYGNQ